MDIWSNYLWVNNKDPLIVVFNMKLPQLAAIFALSFWQLQTPKDRLQHGGIPSWMGKMSFEWSKMEDN